MKTTLLAVALAASFAATACQKTEPAMPADTAAMADAPAMADSPAAASMASANPMVGGAPMYADKDIIENAMHSNDHKTLVAAVQAAGLVDTLKGPGPFTVFAPTDAAFAQLPAGTVDKLLQPGMKEQLAKVLTYHVVPGKLDSTALMAQIEAGGGKAMLTTVEGEALTATRQDGGIALTDAKGNTAMVTTADVMQSNGVIHVIDKVLMP